MAYADEVRDHLGVVNQIYNNAGIGFFGEVVGSQFSEFERVMDVNYWGVVTGTKAFLPHLIASGDGHVVNVSSIWGIFAAPGQSAYNSAKFAVRGFTEALRQEMILGGHPVKVSTVYPCGVKTAIARNATGAQGLDMTELAELFDNKLAKGAPEVAARGILNGVRKNRSRVLVGPGAKTFDLLVRLTPAGYQRLFAPVTGRLMPRGDTTTV
jgi:short-subunit dehydrogenase